MYQKTTIVGRLGRDPEQRFVPSGKAVTSFSVATDRRWTDASGNQQERTVWFRVSCWGKLAETCSKYLSKGRQVLCEGEMQEPKPYQSRDGEWRASLDLTAREVKFLGSKGSETTTAEDDGSDEEDEEIPFATGRGATAISTHKRSQGA